MSRLVHIAVTRTGTLSLMNLPYVKDGARFGKDIHGEDYGEVTFSLEELDNHGINSANFMAELEEKWNTVVYVDTTKANPVRTAVPIMKIRRDLSGTVTLLCGSVKKLLERIPAIPIAHRERIEYDNLDWTIAGSPAGVMRKIVEEIKKASDGFPTWTALVPPADDGGTGSKKIMLYELKSVADIMDEYQTDYSGVEMRWEARYQAGTTSAIEWVLVVGSSSVPHINKQLTPLSINLDAADGNLDFEVIVDGENTDIAPWQFYQSGWVSQSEPAAGNFWIDLKAMRALPSNPKQFMLMAKDRTNEPLTPAEIDAQITSRIAVGNQRDKLFTVQQFDEYHDLTDALGRRITFTGNKRIANLNETVRITEVVWKPDSSRVEITVMPEDYRVYPRLPKNRKQATESQVDRGIKGSNWSIPASSNIGGGGSGGGGGPVLPEMPTFDTPLFDTDVDIFDTVESGNLTGTPAYEISTMTSFQHGGYIYALSQMAAIVSDMGVDAPIRDIKVWRMPFSDTEFSPVWTQVATLPAATFSSSLSGLPAPLEWNTFWRKRNYFINNVWIGAGRIWVGFSQRAVSWGNQNIDDYGGRLYSSNFTQSFVYSTSLNSPGQWVKATWDLDFDMGTLFTTNGHLTVIKDQLLISGGWFWKDGIGMNDSPHGEYTYANWSPYENTRIKIGLSNGAKTQMGPPPFLGSVEYYDAGGNLEVEADDRAFITKVGNNSAMMVTNSQGKTRKERSMWYTPYTFDSQAQSFSARQNEAYYDSMERMAYVNPYVNIATCGDWVIGSMGAQGTPTKTIRTKLASGATSGGITSPPLPNFGYTGNLWSVYELAFPPESQIDLGDGKVAVGNRYNMFGTPGGRLLCMRYQYNASGQYVLMKLKTGF